MFGNLVKPRLLRNTDRMRPNPIDPVGVREDIGHVTANFKFDPSEFVMIYILI